MIDRRCGSSGESTVDFFENIPHVEKIGQNTSGHIHLGNNGFVVLPNSSLLVQLPTSFNTHKDGRFIEKVGIKPDIYVDEGKDILAETLKML